MKIVEVVWVDIVTDGGWHTQNKVDNFVTEVNDTVTQVAYLYEEDENQIVLVDSFFSQKDQFGTIHKIPRGCIKSVRTIGASAESE